MSDPVHIHDNFLEMTIITVEEINDDSPPVRALYEYLKTWANTGDMKEVTFTRDGGNPLLYAWRAERKNLRVLDSTFLFDDASDLDPDITIALPQSWPLSVIQNGAASRQQLISIRALVGIVSFVVVFA